MTGYTATAERGRRTWVVQCDQVPGALSEVSRLEQAEAAIREAIAFVVDVPESSIEVTVRPVLPPALQEQLSDVLRLRAEAAHAAEAASTRMRATALELRQAGWTVRDIGSILDVSHQRVHQLVVH